MEEEEVRERDFTCEVERAAKKRRHSLRSEVFPKGLYRFPGLRGAPLSFRLLASVLLCLLGVSYLVLLASIGSDTEMKMANIVEAYRTFTTTELLEHTFKYLPWFIGTFGATLTLFCLSSYPEKLKLFFVCAVPIAILSDMGSMWLIRAHALFGWQLLASGFFLALCFVTLFALIQRDLW
ncbi:MAG: hypothetical protein A3A73_04845 [Omnitrophica bacterium RIFCSPLOWO2_01_FULL_50_24]|nr:MAG: hypothetical protein A3A73_04845 [Omnitrophica bacterium RIFCSPLOWO2_01_FULL_50_24]